MTSGDDQIPAHLDYVSKGWHPLLTTLHERLHDLCPSYTVMQVKEKFGELRVYLSGQDELSDEAYMEFVRLVDAAEEESATVCESCGKPGRPRSGGWVKTLCDGCAA